MRGSRTRTPPAEAQAQGLGSAKEGAAPWRTQRVTAVAPVPLAIWFVGSLPAPVGEDPFAFGVRLQSPFNTVPMMAIVVAALTLWPLAFGSRWKITSMTIELRYRL